VTLNFSIQMTLRKQLYVIRRIALKEEYFRAETFAFFTQKFMPLEILNQKNTEVFLHKIIDIFQNAKVFSS